MPPKKTPDVDRYPVEFFTQQWSTIKEVVCNVVMEFFRTSKLLKSFSCTIVTLIPKVNAPTLVKDYRPIVCCTTFYKIITKVLTNRIERVISSTSSPSQSAFIEGKSIIDNIFFIHEVLKLYTIKRMSLCMHED